MPIDWTAMMALARAIMGLGGTTEGMWYNWPGDDWMFSALLFGHGGRMLTEDERDIAFAGREDLESLRLIERMVRDAGMPNLSVPGANSVRVTQVMVDNIARVVQQRATPEQVLADMAGEVRRLLPRRS